MDASTRDRVRGAAAWLDASASELLGLAVLLGGGLLAIGLLWWGGRPAPVATGPPVGAATAPTTADAVGGRPPDPAAPAGTATVHVAGAVARPGLVEVAAGARVADALAAAGDVLADADTTALNLARPVQDGERLDVPRVGESPAAPGVGDGTEPAPTGATLPDGTLDLNRATLAELEALPGVGPVTAQRILDFREQQGGFAEVGQLREVSGIGEKRFQALAPLVGV